jgi:hypothetical protein
VIDERDTGALLDGAGSGPKPEDMHVYHVRLPCAHETHASLDGLVARDMEDRHTTTPCDRLHTVFGARLLR